MNDLGRCPCLGWSLDPGSFTLGNVDFATIPQKTESLRVRNCQVVTSSTSGRVFSFEGPQFGWEPPPIMVVVGKHFAFLLIVVLVGNPHFTAKSIFVAPLQRQPSNGSKLLDFKVSLWTV